MERLFTRCCNGNPIFLRPGDETINNSTATIPWVDSLVRLGLALTAALLSGCGPVRVRLYSGPIRPAEEVAVTTNAARVDPQTGKLQASWIVIDAVNGEKIKTGPFNTYRVEVQVPPDVYVVACHYYRSWRTYEPGIEIVHEEWSDDVLEVVFEAQAGRTYRLCSHFEWRSNGKRGWRPEVRDGATNEQVKSLVIGPSVQKLLAEACEQFDRGEYTKCLETCEKARQEQPYDPRMYMLGAEALYKLGRKDDACKVYELLLSVWSGCVRGWTRHAEILLELGQTERATTCLDRALQRDRNNAAALVLKGNILRDTGNLTGAEDCYRRAHRCDPGWSPPLCQLGVVAYMQARYDDALQFFDRALKIQRNNPVLWHNKGMVLCQLERHKEAISHFRKALKLDPYDVGALCGLGRCLLRLKRYKLALAAAERAIELEPGNVDAWLTKEQALRGLGREQLADKARRKAAELVRRPAQTQPNVRELRLH